MGGNKEKTSRRESGACSYATKGIARGVEEESGTCFMTKGTRALWRGHS